MTKKKVLLKTPLNKWHHDHGGQMAAFGDFQLPLWYESGSRIEHLSVLGKAGLFDTCHMATINIEGPGSYQLLQQCFSRDLSLTGKQGKGFSIGKAIYGVFLDTDGYLIDDAVLFKTGNERFLVCINAGKGPKVIKHLSAYVTDKDCRIIELTGSLAKIDLQGPQSARILSLVFPEIVNLFTKFPYFSFKGYFSEDLTLANNLFFRSDVPVMISRSGYTGEFGFELFLHKDYVTDLWKIILDKGYEYEVRPCGLAARDSLRTGAVLPLAGQDIGKRLFINNPWEFALPYQDNGKEFTKDFIGAQALLDNKKATVTYPFAGFNLRKIDINDKPVVLDKLDREIGKVLSCVTDMGIDRVDNKIVSVQSPEVNEDFAIKGLCCGFVLLNLAMPPGTMIFLKDSRRKIPVEIRQDVRPARSARLKISNFI